MCEAQNEPPKKQKSKKAEEVGASARGPEGPPIARRSGRSSRARDTSRAFLLGAEEAEGRLGPPIKTIKKKNEKQKRK